MKIEFDHRKKSYSLDVVRSPGIWSAILVLGNEQADNFGLSYWHMPSPDFVCGFYVDKIYNAGRKLCGSTMSGGFSTALQDFYMYYMYQKKLHEKEKDYV